MRHRLRSALSIGLVLVVAGVILAGVVRDDHPPVVFVHGLGGDASAVGRSDAAFGDLLGEIAERFPRDDVCQRDAQPGRPWRGSPCVFRYVDDVATGGASQSGVEANARKLAAEVAEVSANAGGDPVVLVGYSMGGLIVRAYLALHRAAAARDVAGAIFIHGAVSGSWLLASDEALSAAPTPLDRVLSTVRGVAEEGAGDISTPAHRDLVPGSAVIRGVARIPLPPDLAYVTVWGDIRLALDTPGSGRIDVGSIGDVLLMPGDPTPTSLPPLGGQRLRPTRDSIEIRHGGTVEIGLGEGAGVVGACAIPAGRSCREALAPVLEHPSAHGRIPATMDEIRLTHPVLGEGSIQDLILEAIERAA